MSVQISERDLQNAIVDAAHLYGYLVFHTRPALSAKGWRTPVQYDGKGFVDLVLVGPERIVFAEIKAANGKLSREQEHWLEGLQKVAAVTDRVRVCVWSPADWPDRVLQVLQQPVSAQPLRAHVVAIQEDEA